MADVCQSESVPYQPGSRGTWLGLGDEVPCLVLVSQKTEATELLWEHIELLY